MNFNDCECTNRSINGLEKAIELLLTRGTKINKILAVEKEKDKEVKIAEVQQLKERVMAKTKTALTSKMPPKQRTIFNKILRVPETIDFDVPSLVKEPKMQTESCSLQRTEKSEHTTKVLESVNQSPTLDSDRTAITTAITKSVTKSPSTTTAITRSVTKSLMTKTTPMATLITSPLASPLPVQSTTKPGPIILKDCYLVEVHGKVRNLCSEAKIRQLPDGSFDLVYTFFDETGSATMALEMNLNGNEVKNLKVDGRAMNICGA